MLNWLASIKSGGEGLTPKKSNMLWMLTRLLTKIIFSDKVAQFRRQNGADTLTKSGEGRLLRLWRAKGGRIASNESVTEDDMIAS